MSTPTAERDVPVREHWTIVDGRATRYLEAGSGHPVVLIHGEGSVSETWYDVLKGLGSGYRAIAVDLPGYGYTEPVGDATPQGLAAFVWEFAEVLGLSRPALIGHSLGGLVAVHAALRQPTRAAALVLVDSAGLGRAVNPVMVLQSVTPLGDLTRWLIPLLPYGPELLVGAVGLIGAVRPWRISARWWRSQVQAVATPGALDTTLDSNRAAVGLLGQRHPVLGRLRELPQPTLVLWGIRDLQVPWWQGVLARSRLRNGRLKLVLISGHLLPLERPAALIAAVRPFLATAATAGGNPS
ncbi:alpha/beta fold hydrolase [Saccharothrix obliqua]|uniref:alpha/beta fold hydrolase n=1 Tax=Saccharothrix obliqua TaxID=2861747 RepID=UPI001C600A83|nr:alpha/beta fold hydrolase [Saccharothrix obliqua]MBW4717221.1 alpha/beta fold hydrolase [Saccharothrix obliqua]